MNERQISDGLCAFLRKEGISYVRARMDKKSGIQEGWPDVSVVHCGRAWLCELKTGSGKLSQKQVDCHAQLKKNGNTVVVARSVEEAVESFRAFMGILCRDNDKLVTQAIRERACAPLDNERAAEVVAANSNPDHLWLADLSGQICVFSGEAFPGGLAWIVRPATTQDLATLPRK